MGSYVSIPEYPITSLIQQQLKLLATDWITFKSSMRDLNNYCSAFPDENDTYLCFAVENNCDDMILWKVYAKITCFRVNSRTCELYKLKTLSFMDFMKTFELCVSNIQQKEADEKAFLHHQKDSLVSKECCICFETCTQTVLPCAHSFCLSCILKELQARPDYKCPMCRFQIKRPESNGWLAENKPTDADIMNYLNTMIV